MCNLFKTKLYVIVQTVHGFRYMSNCVFYKYMIFGFSAVTLGFAYKSFNGTEGDTNPLQICAVMVTGELERSIPIYVTTQAPGSTATGKYYVKCFVLLVTTVIVLYHCLE